MNYALVPYKWETGDGFPHWKLPENIVSSIDLRKTEDIINPLSNGYAVCVYSGEKPENSIALEDNFIFNKDAWNSIFGFRPEGDTVVDLIFSHLLDGSDDTFSNSCRPLRCSNIDELEIYLFAGFIRPTTYYNKLQQAVLVRNDLDTIFDDVIAGKLPDGTHRKFLKAEADRLGIDWRSLRSKNKRWKNETPLNPETSYTDTFFSGTETDLSNYNSYSVVPGLATTTTSVLLTGAGIVKMRPMTTGYTGYISGTHNSALSSANMEVVGYGKAEKRIDYFGPACRINSGGTQSYTACSYEGFIYIYKRVGVWSYIGYIAGAATDLAIKAVGSTISAGNYPSYTVSVTDTSISSNLRFGVAGYSSYTGDSRYTSFNSLYARDFVAPTVSSITPNTGPTGTAAVITGANFDSTVTVKFGPQSLSANSDGSTINVTVPSGSGTVNVVVENVAGSGFILNGFTYGASGPPTVLNPTNINLTLNSFFSTSLSGLPTPTSYSSFNLPRWLTLNTSTGLLSGTPPAGAKRIISISGIAINSAGSGQKEIYLNINKSPYNSGIFVNCKNNRPYNQGGITSIFGNRLIQTSGQNKFNAPDLGARLDQWR